MANECMVTQRRFWNIGMVVCGMLGAFGLVEMVIQMCAEAGFHIAPLIRPVWIVTCMAVGGITLALCKAVVRVVFGILDAEKRKSEDD